MTARKRDLAVLAFVICATLLLPTLAVAQGSPAALASGGSQVDRSVESTVSPPLRNQPPLHQERGPDTKPLRLIQHANKPGQQDPVVQASSGPAVSALGGLGFAGVGSGDYGYTVNAAPPDTNLAVGDTQVVQWVNSSFAVFDKATGALAYGPAAGNTLWQSLSSTSGCRVNNDGDPIAQFDKPAHRWVMTQFSVSNPSTYHYQQCVAVSRTSDATGAWNLYVFDYGTTQFIDYPKLGVWPDGYYITYNIFTNGSSFAGPKVCALDRSAMLGGAASALQQCFQLSTSYGSLLPSDLDGTAAPPAGSPAFLLSFGANSLNFWKFHVDWLTPSSTTLTGPLSISVAAFSAACKGGGTCIPQPVTNQQLDSLADRLMYRLAYRNFGDHEALVVNDSVTAGGGQVGVRWYELRSPTGGTFGGASAGSPPVVYQQSTFAPDTNYRWMGSIAMDAVGDIALGYSVSSTSVYPSIRYTGRVPSDPLNTMQGETGLKAGAGYQTYTGGLSRWGDYSSMSVDPLDDCTFWYTNQYQKANGGFNWSTWISSFKFAGCSSTPVPPPNAPSNLAAVAASSSQINLTWTDNSNNEQGFLIERSLNQTAWTQVATVGANVTSYPNSGLLSSTTYFYRVSAFNSEGSSGTSNVASATTPAGPPAAPSNLTATALSRSQIRLNWTDNSNNETGFIVERSRDQVTWTKLGVGATTVGVGVTTYTDSGLSSNTTYYYRVRAVNAYGASANSNVASARTKRR